MDYSKIIIKKTEDICTLKINNPQKLNAIDTTILDELNQILDEISCDSSIKVVILTGEGRAFVAGADIAQMSQMNAIEGKIFGKKGATVFRKIELLPQPVIAAINGFTLGGGCELALAADIRIASTNAKFGQPEVGLGIIPGFSGTQRLSRLIGIGKAKELIYTAESIDANEAYRIGLINQIVAPEQLMDEVLAMAHKIASKAPKAIQYAKEAINEGIQTDMTTAISIENNLFGLCFSTEDQKEGMAAFTEKRKPCFVNK